MKRLILALFLAQAAGLLVIPATSSAQGWNVEMTDIKYTSWHPAEVIEYQGDYAYIGLEYTFTPGGLAVVDISDMSNPIECGYYETNNVIQDIELDGDYAYVGCWGQGLVVLDISTPMNPTEVAVYPTPSNIYNIHIVGELAYISSQDGYLTIADISDPPNLNIISETTFGDGSGDFIVWDDIAYLEANGDSLRVIDVSDPYNPELLNVIGTNGPPSELCVYEGNLYVAIYSTGVFIFDISEPANPLLIGDFDTHAYHIEVADGIAYIVSYSHQLHIYEINDPENPVFLGFCELNDTLQDIALRGNYILVANDYYGFKAISISNPEEPFVYSSYKPDWRIMNVGLVGDYAFVTDGDLGLLVLDVSEPSNMFQVAFLPFIGGAYSVDIFGDYAYVGSSPIGYLVVAINDPLDPRVEGEVDLDGYICMIEAERNRIYVSGNQENLLIYDNSSATNPILLGQYQLYTPGYDWAGFKDIAVEGDLLYGIANWYAPGEGGPIGDSLLILDISDPSNPNFVSMTNLDGAPWQIKVRDNLAYIGATTPMLRIMDVSDPELPELVGSIDFPGTAEEIELHDNYVYIQSGTGIDLRVIDISDPSQPELTGHYSTPDNPQGIAVGDEVIFVADWDHFESYDCHEAVNPVSVAMTPQSSSIVVPPEGSAFDCNLMASNNRDFPATFDGWVNIEVPGGQQFTLLGPVYNLYLESLGADDWDRTIMVPGTAPAGEYRCIAMIGTYPWIVDDQDEFSFVKEGLEGDWTGPEGWFCSGELLPGEDAATDVAIPSSSLLRGNFPNPFNPTTAISYQLSAFSNVNLTVYDISGRKVMTLVDGKREAGSHQVTFDGSDFASGIYFCRL
ncbi:T9SS type A sorting domain-containing protein, partial [bacterium]|nr:T9SS type A sorting domain-containing protein [bacterium]